MKNDEPPAPFGRLHWESWRTPRPEQGFTQPFIDEPGAFSRRLEWRVANWFWLVPPLGLVVAIVTRNADVYAATAVVLWPISLVMWVPAAFYLVLRENPEADLWRAAAYLAHAVSPLAFVVFGVGALVIVFPFGWLLGAWASWKAWVQSSLPSAGRHRLRLMVSGVLGWAFAAAALLTRGGLFFADVLRQHEADGFAIMLGSAAVLIGACSAGLACRLAIESVRASREPQPPPASTAA